MGSPLQAALPGHPVRHAPSPPDRGVGPHSGIPSLYKQTSAAFRLVILLLQIKAKCLKYLTRVLCKALPS